MFKIYSFIVFVLLLIQPFFRAHGQEIVKDVHGFAMPVDESYGDSKPIIYKGRLYFCGLEETEHSGRHDVLARYNPNTGYEVVFDEGYRDAIVYDDHLYFSNSGKLYRYHSSTGVELVPGNLLITRGLQVKDIASYDGSLYMTAYSWLDILELWRYHPRNGFEFVADLNVSRDPLYYPTELIVYSGSLYFRASDASHDWELFRYHPSTGVELAADVNPGSYHSFPQYLTEYKGDLYFRAYNRKYGIEPWKYNPNIGVRLVEDVNPYSGITENTPGEFITIPNETSAPKLFTEYQEKLYFIAYDSIHGAELRSYHPNTGVKLVADRYPSAVSSYGYYREMIVYDNELYILKGDSDQDIEKYHPYSGIQKTFDNANIAAEKDLIVYENTLFFTGRYKDSKHNDSFLFTYTPPCQTFLCRILNNDSGIEATATVGNSGFEYMQAEYVYVSDEEQEDQDNTDPWLLSLESEEGEMLWGESFSIPSELMIPDVDMSSGSLVFASGTEKASQPLMKLNANLVSAGVTQVSFSTDPVEQVFSLQVETDRDARVPLLLSLQDDSGEVTWQQTLEAPYSGVVEELTEQVGSMLTLSVAGEHLRTASHAKGTTQSLTDIAEGNLGGSAIQVYPNPVIDHCT